MTIKKNDAFHSLAKITGLTDQELETRIFKRLQDEGFLQDWEEEVGKTIKDINEQEFGENYSSEQLVEILFPNEKQSIEIPEFIGAIQFWGEGYIKPCNSCGCEMIPESDSFIGSKEKWENFSCINSNCQESIVNEPFNFYENE